MKESKVIKGIIATVAVITFSLPAFASADGLKGRAEKVTYSDLDVDKNAGAEVLYRRLQQASKRVCGVESIKNAGGIRQVARQQECYRSTLDEAVAKVNNAALTSIHEG
jgi:UrcA family protein